MKLRVFSFLAMSQLSSWSMEQILVSWSWLGEGTNRVGQEMGGNGDEQRAFGELRGEKWERGKIKS